MLAWSEVKPLVVSMLARPFERLDFRPPARAMWRYRPHFVDLVWFEAAAGGGVSIQLACTPRVSNASRSKPQDFHFRIDPTVHLEIDGSLLAFLADIPSQRAAFEVVAPELLYRAERWFRKFDTVATALHALRSNTLMGEDHITDASPGSPIYEAILAELAKLQRNAG